MGGQGSGRKPGFKTELVNFALDVQVQVTEIINSIKYEEATFDEVTEKLVKINRKARRVCEENERL